LFEDPYKDVTSANDQYYCFSGINNMLYGLLVPRSWSNLLHCTSLQGWTTICDQLSKASEHCDELYRIL